ncbi:MAG: hypothetical protein IAA97_01450 [Spirochaetes bacterium]|uniref:Uncharacterized protein n=1 Tax=Candidatus Ornithospirochaeta stercoripullorum TaxID=2840899 RepID=A0A9D9DZY6_9SPIO|nr:hypothetical protein [Candidatus Ornithospirochaeta stercoripullorum]
MLSRFVLSVFLIIFMFTSCTTIEEPPAIAPVQTAEEAPARIIIEETDTVEDEIEAEVETEEVSFAVLDIAPYLQSAVITTEMPGGFDFSSLAVDGGGRIESIKVHGHKALLTIADLESSTDYCLSLLSGDDVLFDGITFTTASFAGVYRWGHGDEPFVLTVEDAPSSSECSYYVYINPQDSAFPEGEYWHDLRLYPLVEKGEESLDDVKYKNAPLAYKWNNEKWNTGSMTPSRIKSVKLVDTGSKDEMRAEIASVALGFTATADVSFSFIEMDGNAYLIFSSQMTPGIANSFVKKNPSPGELESEYSYLLERE